MNNSRSLLLWFFAVKLLADYYVPYRMLTFSIVLLLAALLFFIVGARSSIVQHSVVEVIPYLLLLLLGFINNNDIEIFTKLVGLIVLYVMFVSVGYAIRRNELLVIYKKLLYLMLSLSMISIGLSYFTGRFYIRQAWNFEHVNLFGSYLLTFSFPLVYVAYYNRRSIVIITEKVIYFSLCALTHSTGAFLASALVFVNIKQVRLKYAIRALVAFFFIILVIASLCYYTDNIVYKKVAYVIKVVDNAGLREEMADMVSNRRSLLPEQKGEYGSGVWRIYANILFFDYFTEGSYIRKITGRGISGYKKAWGGTMPHNDIMLILIDFGILGIIAFFVPYYRALRYAVTNDRGYIIIVLAIYTLRLLFENNVYSFYIMSNVVIFMALKRGGNIYNNLNRFGIKK